MAITLNQLLKKSYHGELKCVAGHKGLDKEILGVNVVDNPEIVSWLYGGELILSTGYVTKNNPSMLNTLVNDLHRKGCVGLGFKVKRYFEKIPDIIISEGNKYGFPILEISYEMRMSDISRFVYTNLFSDEMSENEKTHLVYQQVTKSVLSGADIEQALFNIADVINNPLFLLDEDTNLIAYENVADNDVNLMNFVKLTYGYSVFNEIQKNDIIDFYKETHFKAHSVQVSKNGKSIDMAILPIEMQKQLFGFLAIPQTVACLNYTDYRILENVVSIIGIHLLQDRLMSENIKHSQNNFVSNVLLSNSDSEDMIKYYCDIYGFDYTKKRMCVNIDIDDFLNMTYDKRSAIQNNMIRVKNNVSRDCNVNCYYANFRNNFLIYCLFSKNVSDIDIVSDVRKVTKVLQKQLDAAEYKYHISISTVGDSIAHISTSFKQSLDALPLGMKLYPNKKSYMYQDMLVYNLMHSSMNYEQIYGIYSSTVKILDEYDKENNTEFLITLESYIDNFKNVSKSADVLHLHRNTMLYRMEKIKDILMMDLDDSEVVLNIQMGIHAKKIIDAFYK